MSLKIKVLAPFLIFSLLALLYIYAYWMPKSLSSAEDQHVASAERHIESVAEALIPLLLAREMDPVYENLETLKERNRDWVTVTLFDRDGKMTYPVIPPRTPVQDGSVPHRHTVERKIGRPGMPMGKLVVEADLAPKLAPLKRRHREIITLVFIVIAGYTVAASLILSRAAIRPVYLLAQASRRLAEKDFFAVLPKTRKDEIGALTGSFHDMREAIKHCHAEMNLLGTYNRSLIEASLDPFVTIDTDGKITDVNAATEKATGRSRKDLVRTDFSAYFTDPDKARAGYQQVFRNGTVRDYELGIRHRDGHVTPVLYNASVYRNQTGDVIGVFAAARDISRRKEAEEEARRLGLRNEMILNSVGEGIYGTDVDGNILFVNPVAAAMLGYSVGELIGRNSHRLFHHTKADGSTYPSEECPLHRSLTRGEVQRGQDEVFWTKDGNRFDVEHVNTPLIEKGRIVGAVVVFRDITERKKSEQRLRESEARLKEAQRIAHLGHWDLDLETNVLHWSDEVYRIFGLEPQAFDATYGAFLEHVHPDDSDFVNKAYTESVKNRTGYDIEHRILRDGETRYVNERCVTEYDDNGTPLRSIGTVLDITERKKAEEEIRALNAELEQRVATRTAELQKKRQELEVANSRLEELDRLKSMFIASMSHELRTPLNSIIGFTSITLEEWTGPLNDEQKKNLEAVLRSGKHLLSLINDIIDISKIEAGKHEVVPEDFDINILMTDAVYLFRKEIEEKGLDLSIESAHIVMHTDRRRLLQCVVNLVSNAVKFTEQGRITVGAGIVPVADYEERSQGISANEFIQIVVADTGIGIKEDDLPKLFSAFSRVPSAISMKVGGTGLGLYLVKKISTELLKGDVAVQSAPGKGSSFRLRIPIRI